MYLIQKALVYVWRSTSAFSQSLVNSGVIERYLFDPACCLVASAKHVFFYLAITLPALRHSRRACLLCGHNALIIKSRLLQNILNHHHAIQYELEQG